MKDKQKGYIDLGGFFDVIAILAVFGILGIISLVFWGIPTGWEFIKPWLHSITG